MNGSKQETGHSDQVRKVRLKNIEIEARGMWERFGWDTWRISTLRFLCGSWFGSAFGTGGMVGWTEGRLDGNGLAWSF